MARRKLLIGISIAGHAALFAGVLAHTVWDLEQVDYRPKVRTSLAVITPPAAEAGPRVSIDRPTPVVTPKPPKIAKELTQPQKTPAPTPAPPDTAVTTGDGTGTGPGDGPPGSDGPPGGDPCAEPGGCELPDLPSLPEPPKPPPPPKPQVHSVTPHILKALRTSGETAIVPPRDVVQEMYRSGQHKTSASLKLCLDTRGQVASITLTQSTKYAEYDAAILDAVRRWRYQPYTVNGNPAPACGVVTFRYEMK
jgi:periplasmic protein TonB